MNQTMPEFEWECKGAIQLNSHCGSCPKCIYFGWVKVNKPAIPTKPLSLWTSTSEKMPKAGDFIVKRWKNGSTWAGIYAGGPKDVSFDNWFLLPKE